MNMDRHFTTKICIVCNERFTPTCGFQVRCIPCKIRMGEKSSKACRTCSTPFVPIHGLQRYCSEICRNVTHIRSLAEAREKTRIRRSTPPQVETCPTCYQGFTPRSRRQKFCRRECHTTPKANGQTKGFRIGRMTTGEYAFFRIMQDHGIHLKFLVAQSSPRGVFPLHRGGYTPDFHDETNNVYYEVIGSRQAFHLNKHKYLETRHKYPDTTLKIVRPDGTEIPFD